MGKDSYLSTAPYLTERACSRWLLPTECLLGQSFPVHPILHADWKISCYNFKRPDRKARQVCAQAGNSMNVVCPFICALHSAVCWQPSAETDRTASLQTLFTTCMFTVLFLYVFMFFSSLRFFSFTYRRSCLLLSPMFPAVYLSFLPCEGLWQRSRYSAVPAFKCSSRNQARLQTVRLTGMLTTARRR